MHKRRERKHSSITWIQIKLQSRKTKADQTKNTIPHPPTKRKGEHPTNPHTHPQPIRPNTYMKQDIYSPIIEENRTEEQALLF